MRLWSRWVGRAGTLYIGGTEHTFPVVMTFNAWHWTGERGGGCQHGPCSQSWPWWKQIAFKWCALGCQPPTTGRRLWLYTRWGALHFDVFVDRSKRLEICKSCGQASKPTA